MGRQNLETRLVESLLVVCLSVFAISNRCSKDSCCAHKGLVTNWPHHSTCASHFAIAVCPDKRSESWRHNASGVFCE